MSRKVIIFDLDGTMADSFDFVTQYLTQQAGKKASTLAERARQFAGLSVPAMAIKLGFPVWRRIWLYFHGRRAMTENIKNIKPFPGIEEVIKDLYSQGYVLFAVSSNRSENIKLFLRQHGLERYFTNIQGNASIVGKTITLRKLLWQRAVDAADCTYVGDEVGDLDAARRLHIRTVAVSWGYNDAAALAAKKPFAVAKTPGDLIKIFDNKHI